ncbi:hypothetical protein EPN95_01305 [Patescibacteria group bacterium]|nr:MAG: hypothetical protein EPN95_01305 [Patescibacteria group bacterium]
MTTDEVKSKLQSLQDDPTMKTVSKYSPTAVEWRGNRLPFVEIHLAYLRAHKLVNPAHYLSNLELMIKKR